MPRLPSSGRPPTAPALAGPAASPSSPAGNKLLEMAARLIALAVFVYLFLVSVNGLGDGFKALGKGFAEGLMHGVSNPILGLMLGVLVTGLVQSSSTTTSMVVGMVGSGVLDVTSAVPIILGANIGTTITNTIVSLSSMSRGEAFRRIFSAAIIHDIFNVLSVLLLLPLELLFGIISRPAHAIAAALFGTQVEQSDSFVKIHFKTVVGAVKHGLEAAAGPALAKYLLLALSFLTLIVCMTFIVRLMKGIILSRVEVFFDRFLGRSAVLAIAFGAILTALVQSSSITTSLLVPLAGTGVVTLEQLLPITLGCNLGTTVTALLASTATGSIDALTIAICHLLFNLEGILVIYFIVPVRRFTLRVTRAVGNSVSHRPSLALAYVLGVFFLVPGLILAVQRLFTP